MAVILRAGMKLATGLCQRKETKPLSDSLE
jgi:hypothetical protein